jgi:hypothetical protein
MQVWAVRCASAGGQWPAIVRRDQDNPRRVTRVLTLTLRDCMQCNFCVSTFPAGHSSMRACGGQPATPATLSSFHSSSQVPSCKEQPAACVLQQQVRSGQTLLTAVLRLFISTSPVESREYSSNDARAETTSTVGVMERLSHASYGRVRGAPISPGARRCDSFTPRSPPATFTTCLEPLPCPCISVLPCPSRPGPIRWFLVKASHRAAGAALLHHSFPVGRSRPLEEDRRHEARVGVRLLRLR